MGLPDRAPAADLRIAQAKAGDVRAFESLYRESAPRIYAVCLRMCADPSLAEEHVQRAFVRAWQGLAGFRGDAGFATWVHRIAVRSVLEDRRATSRSVVQLHADPAADPKERTPPHPGARMDLEAAIATLPDGARHVFVLHDVEGWSHDDIAAALGVTVGTSKSQLHRARALLREVLR
jgi:RNA polymerase sigma-70 factor (ECF subfamily)